MYYQRGKLNNQAKNFSMALPTKLFARITILKIRPDWPV